jgi:hypothetical protein
MTELQRRFVRRWPVAVLAVAGVAAVSLGDVFAGWNSLAGRGSSAAGEYPVRVVLPVPPADTKGAAEALPADAPQAVDQVPAARRWRATARSRKPPGPCSGRGKAGFCR